MDRPFSQDPWAYWERMPARPRYQPRHAAPTSLLRALTGHGR